MRGWGDRLPEGLQGHRPIHLHLGVTQDKPGDLTPRGELACEEPTRGKNSGSTWTEML